MSEQIYQSPILTSTFNNASDVLVLTLGVKRTDGEHITDAQKDAAMNAAKSVLQIIGADVEANSTAILTNAALEENETLIVNTSIEVIKNVASEGVQGLPETDNETEPSGESGS